MSLMGTLAKVAIGVVLAKTVGGMMKGGGGSGGGVTGGGGGPFGGPRSPGRGSGGLEDMMGDIFGRAPAGRTAERGGDRTGGGLQRPQSAPAPHGRPSGAPSDPFGRNSGPVVASEPGGGGGLGDLLDGLTRGSGRSKGGLDDLIGQMGRGGSDGGGLGDLLGGLLGGAAAGGGTMGMKDILNDAFGRGGEPSVAPSAEQEAAAGLMLKAMIQAAKSDGRIDEAEQAKLMEALGDASAEEKDFVRRELAAPTDIGALCRQVPEGLGPQVYAMALMAIDLDNRNEASYLSQLARGLRLEPSEVDDIHRHLNAPALG